MILSTLDSTETQNFYFFIISFGLKFGAVVLGCNILWQSPHLQFLVNKQEAKKHMNDGFCTQSLYSRYIIWNFRVSYRSLLVEK